jgi:hypothetical protein
MTTHMDLIGKPPLAPVKQAVSLDTPRDAATDPRSLERSFEVESPGGHARTVVGRLAYFDEEAQTYMVHGLEGALIRVPVRAITKTFALP